jgi:hypothetical protein
MLTMRVAYLNIFTFNLHKAWLLKYLQRGMEYGPTSLSLSILSFYRLAIPRKAMKSWTRGDVEGGLLAYPNRCTSTPRLLIIGFNDIPIL